MDVRALKDILPNRESKRFLLDPARSFFDSVTIAKKDELSQQWTAQVEEAINALKSITAYELGKLDAESEGLLHELQEICTETIKQHEKLTEKAD